MMADHPPEGPKARFTSEQATQGYVPNPPSPQDLDVVSEAQAQITDEWTGDGPEQDTPSSKP
jgi:hypothetical protein